MEFFWNGVGGLSRRAMFGRAGRIGLAVTAGGFASVLGKHGIAFACVGGGDCTGSCGCNGQTNNCTGFNCAGDQVTCFCTAPNPGCAYPVYSQSQDTCSCYIC